VRLMRRISLLTALLTSLAACEQSPKSSDIKSGTYRRDSGRCSNYAMKNLPQHLQEEAYFRCMEGGGYVGERDAIQSSQRSGAASSAPHQDPSPQDSKAPKDPFEHLLAKKPTPPPPSPTIVGNITVEDGFAYPDYLQEVRSRLRSRWVSTGRQAPTTPAIISFTISRDGQVRDVDVVKPSGQDDYDRVMVGLVIESSPFEPPPTGESVRLRIRF
jgi:TonB family protein